MVDFSSMDTDVVKLLIDKRADVDAKNNNGVTALMWLPKRDTLI